MTLPTFFIIGAQRSGTTSLYHYIGQHPEIFMPPVKEPRYFALEGQRPTFKGPYPKDSPMTPDRAGYEALYAAGATARARGDGSTWYLFEPGAAERIRAAVPEARIIAILRQPAERAYSNYLICRSLGIEPLDGFEAAMAAEPERTAQGWGNPWYYFQKGLYFRQLKRYFTLFPENRISVHLYDDFVAAPTRVLRHVFAVVGVDPDVECDVGARLNTSPRGAAPPPGPLRRLAAVFGGRGPSTDATGRGEASAMPRDARRALTDRYREDITDLGRLIGRDLTQWLAE